MTKLNPSAKSSSLDEKYKELCGYTLVHSTIGGKRFILFHSEPKNNILWLGSIMFIGFCFVFLFLFPRQLCVLNIFSLVHLSLF